MRFRLWLMELLGLHPRGLLVMTLDLSTVKRDPTQDTLTGDWIAACGGHIAKADTGEGALRNLVDLVKVHNG